MDSDTAKERSKHKDLTEHGNKELASLYVVPTTPKIDKETGARVDKETTGKQVLQFRLWTYHYTLPLLYRDWETDRKSVV